MKFFVLAISATMLIQTALAGAVNQDQFVDLIAGYIDGLIGVDIRSQREECSDTFGNAQNNFIDAIDGFKKAGNFWMPITNKIATIKDSCVKMLSITP